MSAEKEKTPEHTSIDLSEKKSVEYWKYRLACSEAELRDAVESVGSEPGNVKEYLRLVRGDDHSDSR